MEMQALSNKAPIKILPLAVLLLAWSANAFAAPAQNVTGWWLDQSGRAGILIAPCGAALCGAIKWLRIPLDAAGKPKTDIHNLDTALRSRPLCGLPMLDSFTPDGNGGWQGGHIYDPESGKTYKSVMHLAADGTLHVRGYIGIPLLGRSAIWTRPAASLAPCQ
jgi:uncharacterized protein (DUF2147 family)